MSQTFFYDGQIRRFIVQFVRMISEFQVEFGKDRNGNTTLQQVPVYYGDSSKQAAFVIHGASMNTMQSVPAMTVYVSSLDYDRTRIQDPTFVGKMNVRQRHFNTETQSYENRQGSAFTIERLMPVPYKLELKVDIWTSNTEQKLQLIEQLGVLFNPALEIQSTDNYVDWTSLTAVFLTSTNWSSRSIPIGTETPIDIATLTFEIPIWISPPAKVMKLGIIQKIITNIHNAQGDLSDALLTDANLMGARMYLTPMDYGVLLIGNQLTLLKVNEMETPREPTLSTPSKLGTKDFWHDLISVYGAINEGVSLIKLELDDQVNQVVGTISYNPDDDTTLTFTVDQNTTPANTISHINAIVDPNKQNAINLATAAISGTRFLILNDVGDFTSTPNSGPLVWRGADGSNLVAKGNDIIEFNGTHWSVSFDSSNIDDIEYVSNLNTGTQYKWNGAQWTKSWEGEFKNGRWTLVI